MQKVYILLRDNKQTGPYSLDEIVALGLKPFDLIWVEGRSCGWAYPSEVNALKPYVPEAPASVQPKGTESIPSTPPTYTHTDTTTSSSPKDIPPPKSIFVSLPGKGKPSITKKEPPLGKDTPPATDWDRRVEEVRQRAQASASTKPLEEELPSLNTHYARSLDEVEEEYTSWVYQQKSKKKAVPAGRLIALLVVGALLLGGGYLAMTSLSGTNPKAEEVSLRVQPIEPQEAAITEPEPVEPAAVGEQTVQPQPGITSPGEVAKAPKKTAAPLSKPVTSQKPAGQTGGPTQNPVAQQPAAHSTAVAGPVEEPVVAQAPQEKKKTLADKIDGFIEKIASKGRSGAPKEEAEPAPRPAPDGSTGERRSTRRGEEGAAATPSAELARQVDVVANNTDNWMMGVKDLKLTVRNNSSVALKRAAVEVSYFSESDNLVDKKTVYVSDIPSKGRKTVAAPDQRMADHVELRLLSVSADDEAYAQQ